MSSFYNKFKNYIEENGLLNNVSNVVIGVSGGADSVCLLLLFSRLSAETNLGLSVVHVNHMLRGEEADKDEAFVKGLCEGLNVEYRCVKKDVSAYAKENGYSFEEAGRLIRYESFIRYAADENTAIAVAHNMEDSVETALHNLIRGTDLNGISGIKNKTFICGKVLIRPLLFARRKEIEEYLTANKQSYKTDATNLELDYTRNKIRSIIIKTMEEINPQAVEHIKTVTEKIAFANSLIDKCVEQIWDNAVMMNNRATSIDSSVIIDENPDVKKRLIYKVICKTLGKQKDITKTHVEAVLELCLKNSGQRISLPDGFIAVKENKYVVIGKPDSNKSIKEKIEINKELVKEGKQDYVIENGRKISFDVIEINDDNFAACTEKNLYTKVFDYDKILNSLFLGKRDEHDFITLKNGRKMLNRYMIDNKIPRDKRDDVLILKDDQEVIWIVGYRISEKYKITKETKTGLIVTVCGDIYE